MEPQDRAEQFKSDIAEMGLRDPVTARERALLVVGALAMVAGPVVAIIAYAQSSGTNNPLQQGQDDALALFGVALAVVGAALFVRYSIGTFLRFWLARLSYEQHAQTERLIDALAPSASPSSASPSDPAVAPPPKVATTPTS